MGRRYLPIAALLSLTCVLPLAAGAGTRYFRGMLDDHLRVDEETVTPWTWQTATQDEIRRLGVDWMTVAQAFAGECLLPDAPKLPVHGRVVAFKDGRWTAFLDLNRDGVFGPGESAPLHAPQQNARLLAAAYFQLQLPQGAYREMPVLVGLPKTDTTASGGQTVLIGTQPLLDARVQLPDGPILMRFSYNAVLGTLNKSAALEWMDVNRDGHIDRTPGSPEFGNPVGEPPVFHTKGLYLQATTLDTDTRTFAMKTVQEKEYHRIEMGVGDRLPDFTFRDLEGRKRHLSDIKGDYRLLDFWRSGCMRCVNDLPVLRSTYARYHKRGFQILGMNGDADPQEATVAIEKTGITWPQASLDEEMKQKRFQIVAWPTRVLIDRHNKVISISQADHFPLDGRNLEQSLATLMPPEP